MAITRMELIPFRVRCRKPFRIASDTTDVSEGLLVRLSTERGEVGLGEACPKAHPTGESLSGTVEALERQLFPALQGRDPWALEELHAAMEEATSGHPSARAAMDLALHDLLARRAGVPLHRFLGGTRNRVPTDYSIGLCPPREAAEEALDIVRQGYRAVKLKVGTDPAEDLERIRAVRGAIGPDVILRLDANEGWDFVEARRVLREAEAFDVELCEQPLARWDLEGMARLRRGTRIPLAADESVASVTDAARVLRLGAVDIINLKLMKCGGILPARRICALARAYGVRMMVGGMVGESRVAVTAAAAVAAAWGFEHADLDADLLLSGEPVREGGVEREGPDRVLPERPGLGVEALDESYFTGKPREVVLP